MRVTVPSRMLWSAIIVLILAAMVDSFLLARSYIARNADTVVIVATLLTPTVDPNTGRRYEPVGRLRYTGAQATAIKRVFDGDALNPGAYSASSSNPSIFTPPIYQYTLSFQLFGVTTAVIQHRENAWFWTSSVLGIPGQTFGDYSGVLFNDLIAATNGLPTNLDPAYAS